MRAVLNGLFRDGPPAIAYRGRSPCTGARTFVQGLVASFASSAGVNVYSPWTGDVVCTMPPLRVRR